MQYSQLIQLYFERSGALQSYWTIYVAVIGGLLAVSNLRIRRDRLTVVLVTVLYACFAYKNLSAIEETSVQRSATLMAIHQYHGGDVAPSDARPRELIEPTLVETSMGAIQLFHISCDVLTIGMLWAMERRRAKMAEEQPQA